MFLPPSASSFLSTSPCLSICLFLYLYLPLTSTQEKQKAAEATPLQQITELETYRANLMQKKIMLDKSWRLRKGRKRGEDSKS
jgi:hypothetical protein